MLWPLVRSALQKNEEPQYIFCELTNYSRNTIFIPLPTPLTLLHSEQPKLCRVLAVLSAIGLISMSEPFHYFTNCVRF